ncbi:MAG: L-histidine N(alpha)-methyltransferase [Bryobacteraceae bacterium]
MNRSQFAADVQEGLCRSGQKQLPPNYFYDDLGTTLFEAITLLPEYGLARADVRLIKTHAPDLAALCNRARQIVELGSGTGSKTRPILTAWKQAPLYVPIDVSQAALDRCRAELGGFTVHGVQGTYLEGLKMALAGRSKEPVLVLFLGSTIGNFDRDDVAPFLSEVHALLRSGDWLLLGTDLVKDHEQMLLAYDDPTGVTAAFNLNVLARINRELGGNFNLRRFRHEARWNEEGRRIEMHLRSEGEQSVCVPGMQGPIEFLDGETIWTESSHKFDLAEICDAGMRGGFHCVTRWVDQEWPFAETLFVAQ